MTDASRPEEALCLELVRVQRQLEAIYELEPTPAIAPRSTRCRR